MIATMKKTRILAALCALVMAGASCAEEGVHTPLEPGAAALSESSSSYRLVRAHPVFSDHMQVQAWIDTPGGTLSLAGHQLAVSPSTVSKPTLFTMKIVNNGYTQVELTAHERDPATGQLIDVGAKGFKRRVNLKLNYAYLSESVNPDALTVVWLVEDSPTGKLKPLATKKDSKGKFLTTLLDHFSMYAVATS